MERLSKESHSSSFITQNEEGMSGSTLSSNKSLKYQSKKSHHNITKFRYQSLVYSVGDTVMLSNDTNDFYVAKIRKIILKGGIPKYKNWPTMEVQWYYRKQDIINSSSKISDYLKKASSHELFESNHIDNVIIESIIGKCQVTVLENSDQIDAYEKENFFYTTSNYNHITVSLFNNMKQHKLTPIVKSRPDDVWSS